MNELLGSKYEFYVFDIIGIIIIYQSLVHSFFLLFVRKNKKVLSHTLSLIFTTISFHFIYIILENTVFDNRLMLGVFFGLLYGPQFYLYTSSLIYKKLNFKSSLYHFLPAFIFLAFTFILFYIESNFLVLNISYFSLLVTAHITIYIFFSFALLNRYTKRLKDRFSSIEKINLWWLKAIFYLFLAIILFAFIKEVLPIGASGLQIFLIVLFGLILIVVNSFFYLGIRQVGLFLGFEPEIRNNNAKKKYSIPKNEHAQLRNKLLNYIEEEKPYQKFELSLNELAENLDTSSRKLSFLINSEFKQNFFEFISSYRINEAKKLLTETNSSIKEIMYDSGFGNKSTFNSIFKKQTGFSPSMFRNNMKTKS